METTSLLLNTLYREYSAPKIQFPYIYTSLNLLNLNDRSSTRFRQARWCWLTTIHSTLRCYRVSTPYFLDWGTRQRVAESTRCARCTGVLLDTRPTRTWSPRSCRESSTSCEGLAATIRTCCGSSGTWKPRRTGRMASSARTRIPIVLSRGRTRLSGRTRPSWRPTRTSTNWFTRGSCRRNRSFGLAFESEALSSWNEAADWS